MRRNTFIAVLAAAAIGIIAIGAASASAATAGKAAKPLTCDKRLRSGTYESITVPAGATCNGVKATVTVRSNVRVESGATFVLGNEKHAGGGTIRGSVRANDPASVQLHFAHVNGSVSIVGGNGFFSTVEDNVIGGSARIDGYTGFWLGFIRNTVRGSAYLNNNQMDDPDANEYVTNTIAGDLVCHNDSPAPQIGDSMGSPNKVGGRKVDQCAGL
jgi:hypothetical protein